MEIRLFAYEMASSRELYPMNAVSDVLMYAIIDELAASLALNPLRSTSALNPDASMPMRLSNGCKSETMNS